MTREEAIAILQDEAYFLYEDDVPYNRQAFEMAIQALSQELCDDAISREDAEECKELMTDINGDTVYAVRMSDIRELPSVTQKSAKDYLDMADRKAKKIKDALTVTHKSGKWKQRETDNTDWWECSECGAVIYSENEYDMNEYHRFCGRCGAEMESEE